MIIRLQFKITGQFKKQVDCRIEQQLTLQMNFEDVEYSNVMQQSWLQRIAGVRPPEVNRRVLVPFRIDSKLPTNQIHTSKYTPYNFLPKNIWEQITKASNLYFLIIGIFQIMPYTTLTNGIPVIYIPLGIIMLLSAVKDAYEDYKRSQSDKNENETQYSQLNKDFSVIEPKILSKNILPGMVIMVRRGQHIPVDGLILSASQQQVFVSTKNLDGETNLKKKKTLYLKPSSCRLSQELVIDRRSVSTVASSIPLQKNCNTNFKIQFEPPNNKMNQFKGDITYIANGRQLEVEAKLDNILMRGSQLESTEYVYLMALYTGMDTKILMSMEKPSAKKSTIQLKLKKLIIVIFCLILALAVIMTVLKLKIRNSNRFIKQLEPTPSFFYSLFGWILNLTNLVPISLIVTLQMVRLIQGKIISYDPDMANSEFQTKVNCSNVIEGLGTVEAIASDKTGTLTKNKLTLRQIGDGTQHYSESQKKLPENINKLLCLCNEAYINHKGEFQSESQDETCILTFCHERGGSLKSRNQGIVQLELNGKPQTFIIKQIISFTSERRRQSVIFQDSRGDIFIVTKGGDDIIKKLLHDQKSKQSVTVLNQLQRFAHKGYRTLLMASRQITEHQFSKWHPKYTKAKKQQSQNLPQITGQIQTDLRVVCAIGIEDQLQDEVPETIRTIIEAGIKFVIISGDKKQTVMAIAKNIKITDEPYLAQSNQYLPVHADKPLVVFARCSPKQKQEIVSAMQGRVLAIGDGANDVSMITKATIGVGIAGKQGKAAVQAADFGIPEFKYLRRLLFFYGRQIYRRNSQIVKYNFYKNFLYTFPQVTFGFFSGYTGVAIYQSFLSQLYNLLFTSLPIMFYAWCDQAEEQEDLMANKNNLYATSKKQIFFSNYRIFFYLLEAVVLGFTTSYLCFLLVPIMYRSPNDLNIYQISSILMLYVVVYANLRVLFMQRYLNLMVFIAVIVGIVAFFIAFKVILLISTLIERSYKVIFYSHTGLIIFICVLASLILTLIFQSILNHLYSYQQVKVEKQQHRQITQIQQVNVEV